MSAVVFEKRSVARGILLSVSGGIMDAYSFIARGGVFANAQTGNIVLLGVNLSTGEFAKALHYLFPICAFALGVFVSYILQNIKKSGKFPWEAALLLMNAALLPVSAFIPVDTAACALISFCCGAQLSAFRKTAGVHVATTMCIGNLQNLVRCITEYIFKKDKELIKTAFVYGFMLASFFAGAVLGNALINLFGVYAVCFCAAFQLAAIPLALSLKNSENE